VILPHRMLKNQVIEKTGVKAYALFSEAAAQNLNLRSLCEPLTPYVESFEGIGEINMLVHDLKRAWDREQTRKSHFIDPASAWFKIEFDIPYPPSIVWDYVTTPELEAHVLGLDFVKRVDDLGGRTQAESRFHCSHSSGDFFNKIIDWKPFDYYTTQQFVADLEYYRTIRLQYDGVITKFSVLVSKPEQEAPEGIREFLEEAARQGYKNLPAAIQKGINDGKTILPQESG